MNEKLRAIIADITGSDPSTITPETSPETCEGWDSLAQVVMISTISDEMGVEIPFDKMMDIHCVQDFIDIVGD